jgi:hypothetical protein
MIFSELLKKRVFLNLSLLVLNIGKSHDPVLVNHFDIILKTHFLMGFFSQRLFLEEGNIYYKELLIARKRGKMEHFISPF